MSRKYYVYEVIDPRNELPFYVGYTSRDPSKRLYEHIQESRQERHINRKKNDIIKQIRNGKKEPIIRVLFESTSAERALIVEAQYINKYKRILDGGILTNISKGGEHHVVSDEVKKSYQRFEKENPTRTYTEKTEPRR